MAGLINLTQFGWDGICIPADLTTICKYLPKWYQIKTLRDPQHHGHRDVYFPHQFFYDLSGNRYMPALQKCELHNNNGAYSQVFKAQRSIYRQISDLSGNVSLTRETPFVETCIKEIVLKVESDADESDYIEEINAILYEVYLHALIEVTLTQHGLERYVPHLFEVVATTNTGEQIISPTGIDAIWMSMEFMDGCTLEKYLATQFSTGTKIENTRLLKDILCQLCYILHILQFNLLFNHRDLKLNNLFVRFHKSTYNRRLNIPHFGSKEFKVDLVMIDFGFSCIACGSGFKNPRKTLLGAGSYFGPEHDCLKKGRDLAQFLYCLHCAFPLQKYIERSLFDLIHGAMRAERNSFFGKANIDLFNGLDVDGNPLIHSKLPESIKYNDGIYVFLRDNTVEIPGCEPIKLLEGLAKI